MAENDNREFEQLFAAFSNADVTTDERERMHALASGDLARRGAVAEVEALHELVAAERSLRAVTMRPVEPVEEADESYRRIAAAAARAGETLRAQMLHPSPEVQQVTAEVETPRFGWALRVAALAAVALIAVAVGMLLGDDRPPMSTGTPADKVLGGGAIQVTTRIDLAAPELSWTEVDGAASYEVSIFDSRGAVVLRRAEGRRFTRWPLTATDLGLLTARMGQLSIEVIARRADARVVGRSPGRQPLQLR